MHVIRDGNRFVNLRYFSLMEPVLDGDGSLSGGNLTLMHGRVIELGAEGAATVVRYLDVIKIPPWCAATGSSGTRPGVTGTGLDPATGNPMEPGEAGERDQREGDVLGE